MSPAARFAIVVADAQRASNGEALQNPWYAEAAWETDADLIVCNDDDFFATGVGSCRKRNANSREAQAYVNFIVQNWQALPERIAFIHGHAASWHHSDAQAATHTTQPTTALSDNHWEYDDLEDDDTNPKSAAAQLLDAPWPARLTMALVNFSDDYLHLGERATCTIAFNQTDWCEDAWPHAFAPYLRRPACPARLCTYMGAEYVVSRRAVERLPLAFWRGLHDLLLGQRHTGRATVNSSAADGADLSGAYLFEWTHHLLFGAPDVLPEAERVALLFNHSNRTPEQQFGNHLASVSASIRLYGGSENEDAYAFDVAQRLMHANGTDSVALGQLITDVLLFFHWMTISLMSCGALVFVAHRLRETHKRVKPKGPQCGFRTRPAAPVQTLLPTTCSTTETNPARRKKVHLVEGRPT